MAGNTPGPESIFEDEKLFAKIREAVFMEKDLGEIADFCEIPRSTFYTYHASNYQNLKNRIINYENEREQGKRDKMFKNAEACLMAITEIGTNDKETLRVVADVSKYLTSTLGNKIYKTKNEQENSGSIDIKISKEVAEKYNDTTRNTIGNSEG